MTKIQQSTRDAGIMARVRKVEHACPKCGQPFTMKRHVCKPEHLPTAAWRLL
jgi:predicted RNA-binding Zn-ribbon protein involved in translation (DUF1610 family)